MASSESSAKPVWTGDGCTTVLRGATSHPKRWPGGSGPTAPAPDLTDRQHAALENRRCRP
jgi:hypothetical protein